MKFTILLPLFFLAPNAFAENRIKICQYFYQHEIFTGYLSLSLEKKQDHSLMLWMETPTPYGIRPYTYKVSTMSCTPEGSLHMEAQSSATTQNVIFNSKNSNQSGKLEYVNSKKETQLELILECQPEKIKELCP